MGLFGFFTNEEKEKEEMERDYILCPSTGNKYKTWKEYGEATDPYSIGEEYGRKQLIVFPDLNDYLDCHAALHVRRAITTHDNVIEIKAKTDDLQKKLDTLIKLNEQLIEQNKNMAERIEKLEQER